MLPHGWNINNGYILMKSDFTGYYWQMFFLSSLQEKYVMLDFGEVGVVGVLTLSKHTQSS